MSGYTPSPYQITDKMLQFVVSISEKVGQIKSNVFITIMD